VTVLLIVLDLCPVGMRLSRSRPGQTSRQGAGSHPASAALPPALIQGNIKELSVCLSQNSPNSWTDLLSLPRKQSSSP
jgi:hypothetical protein